MARIAGVDLPRHTQARIYSGPTISESHLAPCSALRTLDHNLTPAKSRQDLVRRGKPIPGPGVENEGGGRSKAIFSRDVSIGGAQVQGWAATYTFHSLTFFQFVHRAQSSPRGYTLAISNQPPCAPSPSLKDHVKVMGEGADPCVPRVLCPFRPCIPFMTPPSPVTHARRCRSKSKTRGRAAGNSSKTGKF